ncbi:MAG TPA: RHS repeat domain-containing protein [Allosphingosinicella sp.]
MIYKARIRIALAGAAAAALPAPAAAAETISYGYDARGRLVRVERAGTANGSITAYAFDRADNRTAMTVTSAPGRGYRILPTGAGGPPGVIVVPAGASPAAPTG